jgi:LysR family transcriptional regulator, pca operon transcriptional activator
LPVPRRYLDRRLKLPLLRVADALATHGSLLKASASLGVGQPALTRSLAELERIAGARLFERHARGVTPTVAGVAMIRLARRVLAELRRGEEELDSIGDAGRGSVAVGALPVASVGVLPGVLVRLRQRHPKLRVRLEQGRTEELLPLLAARQIDLVVGRLYPPAVPDGFRREALWDEPISVLARAGHPLLSRRMNVTAEALAACEFVLPTITQRVGQEIEHALARIGLAAEPALRSSSYGLIREMLLATDLVSVMPRSMMLGDLLRGDVRVVPLAVSAEARPAGLVLPGEGEISAAAAAFCEALRGYATEVSAAGFGAMPDADSQKVRNDRTGRRRRA